MQNGSTQSRHNGIDHLSVMEIMESLAVMHTNYFASIINVSSNSW